MSAPYLVTYATRYGSTAGVAKIIRDVLAEGGMRADLMPMTEVRDLTPYGAVVAGSPVHDKKWLPEAMEFLRNNQAALRERPFAAFQVCMTLAMPDGEDHRTQIAAWMGPVFALVRPVSEASFAGALDIAKIDSAFQRLKFRASIKMGVWKEGDHRDPAAIEAWARTLKRALG